MIKADHNRLKELLKQWHDHTLPAHDQNELLSLLERSDLEYPITEEMKEIWDATPTAELFKPEQKETMLTAIIHYEQPRRIKYRYRIRAAVLLGVILAGFFLLQQPQKTKSLAKKAFSPAVNVADVSAPATNKAILTLSDGKQITLEDVKEGHITNEEQVNVVKLNDGQLVYSGSSAEVKWHTLTVPEGSKPIRLTLADGSHVTLNVASSITYPTAFSGDNRQVSMTGEAYFEVAHLSSPITGSGKKPFIVTTNSLSVEVKGTKFNVNAYGDEETIKTTLVEGAVNIVSEDQQMAIAPGEQAIVTTGTKSRIKLKKNGDVEEAMAWINGKFHFHNADVEAVMRQVARWYDVEVKFTAKPKMRFGGQIDRNSTLRQMLTILETSGLNFTLDGNIVTIIP
jgi:transmembrane sensor